MANTNGFFVDLSSLHLETEGSWGSSELGVSSRPSVSDTVSSTCSAFSVTGDETYGTGEISGLH